MPDTPKLTIERLFASPALSGPSARAVKFSPDGKRVTFLAPRMADASRFDLWAFEVETGEASMLVDSTLLEPDEVELSEEEKALRERQRIAGQKGIVSYDWGTEDMILVPIGGDLHLVALRDGETPSVRRLTESEAFEYDAKVSPGGRYVSFVRDGAVYAIDLETDEEQRLTPLAEPDKAISFGVAEFVAQEEMSRYTGYWWSPDDKYLAYTRVDESTVDIIPRFDIDADGVTVIEQRYPRAGRPNAVVDLFVRDIETDYLVQASWRVTGWGPATDQYLARVMWHKATEGAAILTVQRVNRDQTRLGTGVLDLRDPNWSPGENAEDPSIAAVGRLLEEFQPNWINLSFDLKQIGDRRIFTTEEPGHRHIFVDPRAIGARGRREQSPASLTSGDWSVAEIAGGDQAGEMVFFTGFKDTPLERHLYSVPLSGGDITRITEPGKSWSITMSPDGQSFVGTSSSPTQPPQTGLYRADGSLIAWIEENPLDTDHPYTPYLSEHTVPEYGTLTAEDGQTLYYSIQTPPDFDASKRYPVIVEVYGGPLAQMVTRDWERMSDQFYTRQGYIVFRLDNRGSGNRGKAFEDVIYRQLAGPEVRDQLKGVDWLKAQPFVDPDRIAIQGWSYGGYMALMTILQAPEGTFAAAVAGAPVTDWRLYDTFYTERYMDTPESNPEGYEQSSVFAHIDKLSTPLLLMHGMADDNVTFDNTTRLMAALQEAGKPFELMTYPGQRHGIRGEALQTHLMRTRMAFLDRHLNEPAAE